MDFTNRDSDNSLNMSRTLATKLGEHTRGFASAALVNISLENMTDVQRSAVTQATTNITAALESIRSELSLESQFTRAQIDAANQAGIMASGIDRMRQRTLREVLPSGADGTNTVTLEAFGVADSMQARSYATEAYDEKDNRSAVAFSITYNLQTSRQDEFGEALYPTVTIPADQAGVTITNNILYVQDNVDRNISGATYQLNRKNVLRALADATVLRKDQTRAQPVYRSQSQAMFVDTALVANSTQNLDGTSITTSPLAVGKEIDLLGISQSDAMIASGVQNQTDTLDPTVDIANIYVQTGIGGTLNVMKFPVLNTPFFNFVPNAQGDYKLLTLTAESTSILINDSTKQADGTTALAAPLAAIATNHFIFRMKVSLNGRVRTDTGNLVVYPGAFEVAQVTDANGVVLDPTTGAQAAIVTALNAGKIIGYDVIAFRSNQNRRQQGQFIDVNKKFQRYLVPLRSPLTARHPAHVDGQVDASDVQALVTTTRIRIANEAVTSLFQANDQLAAYVDTRDTTGEGPEILGVGRYYVRPYYLARNFDAALSVDSLSSSNRPADIQAALVNQIRDMAYLLYRQSEYKAASDAIYGGVGPVPTVVLATDPYTARYLMVTGDLRTLGPDFNVMVVSTLDTRMRGKVAITFGLFDGERNSQINPLNNGNLLWAPELVLTANIGRGGQYSRETLVQPRYRFIQNLPVMGWLTVSNIPSTIGKLPLNVVDTTP